MLAPLLAAAPPDWRSVTLATAEASFDPGSILNSGTDYADGIGFDVTGSGGGSLDELPSMASWVWPATDVLGRAPLLKGDGSGAAMLQALLREVSGVVGTDLIVLAGFLDEPDPTSATVSGFGCGLSWSSAAPVRSPRCWLLSSGAWSDHASNGASNDSIACAFSAGRRKQLWREFSGSGVKSDGEASNDLAFLTGSNLTLTPSSGLYLVLGVGVIGDVTNATARICPWFYAAPPPVSGYLPARS